MYGLVIWKKAFANCFIITKLLYLKKTIYTTTFMFEEQYQNYLCIFILFLVPFTEVQNTISFT
jgi:hypothetical protein